LFDLYLSKFKKKVDIEQESRQHLANYFVHFEEIATFVKNRVIQIQIVDDLMSYRHFIAINNPVFKELKLNEPLEYYKDFFDTYDN